MPAICRLQQSIHNTNVTSARVVRGMGPAAWFRFNRGVTVTGAGVSQWDDASGNARHLLQATDTNRPALQADGSILFDGVDNYLKCDAFTLNQPETIYLLMKQVTWTLNESFTDGNDIVSARMNLFQSTASPGLAMYSGAVVGPDNGLAVGAYGVVAAVFNGASSLIQVNANAATAGNAGTNNAGGFTLGARGDAATPANVQVMEVILFAAAHNAAQRAVIVDYLRSVGGLA